MYTCVYIYIYIYIYTWRWRWAERDGVLLPAESKQQAGKHWVLTDGIGTPDPNPKHLVNWRFKYSLLHLTFV